MSVFADYARYYNLLYKDKDYAGEVDFILSVLREHGASPKILLDLGCGTGRHALEMARRDIAVSGVDMSETMLSMGREMFAGLNPAGFSAPLPVLHHGDARTVRLGETFDAVTSLFHVMSYQNSEEDALAVMATAKAHLKPGGLFLFDFWYGPGVLTDLPVRREKRMEDERTEVFRTAVPVHRANDNIIEVHYDVILMDKENGAKSALAEVHHMRYWFMPELRNLAKQTGFREFRAGHWMNFNAPSLQSWNAWVLLGL